MEEEGSGEDGFIAGDKAVWKGGEQVNACEIDAR
jgi:hypothetical protein